MGRVYTAKKLSTIIDRKGAGWLHCPWCGQTPNELSLTEGDTYQWAIVSPSCCGNIMGEIRRASYPAALGVPEDHASAIAWWNGRQR
jgi:hypothetical protein